MTDWDAVRQVMYGGGVGEAKPRFDTILSYKKVGLANLTKTQRLLQRKNPKQLPEWYWVLMAERPSWRHATTHQVRFYSVSVVLDQPSELKLGDESQGAQTLSVAFTTKEV